MRIKELQLLLNSQPSVSGNTFLVGALYVISWALTLFFLVLGVGLLSEGFLGLKIFLNWISRSIKLNLNNQQHQNIALSFGWISFVLAVIFSGVIYLCKMVLRRNHYIIQIEEWLFQNIPDSKKTNNK